MMRFQELTDDEWEFIRPYVPIEAREGRPRADDRRTINAILYVLTTGCRWMDLPKEYGDDSTANLRLRRWEEQGVWKRMMDALIARGSSSGLVKMNALSVDSSSVASKKGEPSSGTTHTRGSTGPRYMPRSQTVLSQSR
jgi:transposase